ncbi:PREDICTED: uncharacterized protein LOC106748375 [Dinoponera quadriceps]|uniref:Uncharacterized protein LOC106748375 n=1 Tax=Dinoponera quadriceps TaxID=609295 RepID=A0A6P3XUT5_DINQU|nr:PREDICTED: uncharacterized protein LOC106748375 [Dinoponera quadriceps]
MNWFRRSRYMTFRSVRKTSLQLQILLINAVGLFNLIGNNFNWGWLKGDLQLKKIWELPVLQPDNSDVTDIDWIKTILSQIVVARFVINSVSLVAHIANIYTILMRDRQDLLIFWMVLSFVKDILLEVIVVTITLILWRNGSITTSLLVEFIAKKAIRLAISIWKWCTTLNWYMQLRKVAKLREFFESIVRRNDTGIIDTVGRAGYSLDDASLCIAIARRGKCASLLSLHESPEESSNRVKLNGVCPELRATKSLTTLIINDSYDTNGTNDHDSIGNDLSVAEKSMKMLDITAEDVMDARARIQERSYWDERYATARIFNPVENMMTRFPRDKYGIEGALRNGRAAVDNEGGDEERTADIALEKEDAAGRSSTGEEKEKDNSETVLRDGKKEISTEGWEETISLLKNGHVTSDKVKGHIAVTKSSNFNVVSGEKEEEAQEAAKIVQNPSKEYERNPKAESRSSPVKDAEAEFSPVPVGYEYKLIGEVDERKHPCRVETALAVNANGNSESSEMSSLTCHCTLSRNINSQKNKEHSRSTNVEDKSDSRDIGGKKSKGFASDIVTQGDESNGRSSALIHLGRSSKKRTQTSREYSGTEAVADWNSVSLVGSARPSGYEKRSVAGDESENRKSVQTEISESVISLSEQRTRSPDLHAVSDFESFGKETYGKFQVHGMTEASTLETYDFMLEDEKRARTRNRYDLRPNRRLSLEEREAIELRALKAYNEQTLLEDKKELEARKRYDSSLGYERSVVKVAEISKVRDLKTFEGTALFGNEVETITGKDLSRNFERSIDDLKLEVPATYKGFTFSGRNLIDGRKNDSSKHAASSARKKDTEIPMVNLDRLLNNDNVSGYPSEAGVMSCLSKTRDDTDSHFDLDDRNARHDMTRPLNLWEVTRNIKWSPHPQGIILTNKGLLDEPSENKRFRESQRDIVDNDTVSVLHNAFFFKPEITIRIFRHAQTRLEGSSPNFERREDFSVNFICRVNNEIYVQDRDSLPDSQWITEGRNNLSHSFLLNVNSNHIAEEENGHDLCIIFIGREEVSESETSIAGDLAEPRGNMHLSVEDVQATNILVFDANCQTDRAINDNLPVQFIISVLRNFGIEVSQESIRDVLAGQIEEYGGASDVAVINDFPSHVFHTAGVNSVGRNNYTYDQISSSQGYNNDMIEEKNPEILCLNNNGSDNLSATSSVKSLKYDNYYDLQDEKYLSAIDINVKDKVSENNLSFVNVDNDVTSRSSNFDNNDDDDRQLGYLNDEKEENEFNLTLENSTEISPTKTLSLVNSYSQTSILKSIGEELQKLTQLSNENFQATSENVKRKPISNSDIKSNDNILQSRNIEILKLTSTTQNGIRNKNECRPIYGRTKDFLTDQFLGIYSSDESDINSLLERNSSEPTVNGGSLMEEFSNDTIPPRTSSNIFADNSSHSLDNEN